MFGLRTRTRTSASRFLSSLTTSEPTEPVPPIARIFIECVLEGYRSTSAVRLLGAIGANCSSDNKRLFRTSERTPAQLVSSASVGDRSRLGRDDYLDAHRRRSPASLPFYWIAIDCDGRTSIDCDGCTSIDRDGHIAIDRGGHIAIDRGGRTRLIVAAHVIVAAHAVDGHVADLLVVAVRKAIDRGALRCGWPRCGPAGRGGCVTGD